MAKEDTTERPTTNVKSLNLKRTGYTITGTWVVPKAMTKDDAKAKVKKRATSLDFTWTLGIAGKDPKVVDKKNRITTTSDHISINNFDAGTKTYTRASFYPLTTRKMSSVTLAVAGRNAHGADRNPASVTVNFHVPKRPTVSSISFNPDNGRVSATITAAADEGSYERYDTEYVWRIYNSNTKSYLRNVHTTTTNGSTTLTYDIVGYQGLPYGKYIKVSLKARSRGLAGRSAWAEAKDVYIAFPNVPTIKRISIPSKSASGKVTAHIDVNASTRHPVTQVRLQALVNVAYSKEADIPADAAWTPVGAPDNSKCTALSTTVADTQPSAGNWSWLRVFVWSRNENALIRYSAPMRMDALHVKAPTAGDDDIWILSAEPGEDGSTAIVQLGWGRDGHVDDATGTQLTWSDQPDTWRSTDDPESYEFTWDDGSVTTGAGTADEHTYSGSATITIKGLEQGATTYVQARRYMEGDTVTYGNWSDMASIIPSVAPSSVTLEVPSFVAAGAAIPFSWTFSGDSMQTGWQLVLSTGTIVADGTDATGYYELDAERAAELATLGVLTVSVAVSTGGGWVTSESRAVTIVDPPTLSITVPATLTAQPLAFDVACSSPDAELLCVVTADGVTSQMPAELLTQPAGDTVWSDVVQPIWSSGAATVTLPSGLQFIDLASYTVSVVAVDTSTGLSSAEATATTTVAWTHQAPSPDGYVTLTPINRWDANMGRVRSMRISLTPPDDSATGDLYDIYRMTADGASLIGEGWPLTATAIDTLAPFGDGVNLAYRIAIRTSDGDVEWADVPYELPGDVIRIDWSGNSVELPYNIALSGSYSKNVDIHTYLDGTTEALYGQGVMHEVKLSTDVIRLDQQDEVAAVIELAHYLGTAFVRTPDGLAYEADVQVTEAGTDGPLYAFALDAKESRLTQEHMLPPFNVEEAS